MKQFLTELHKYTSIEKTFVLNKSIKYYIISIRMNDNMKLNYIITFTNVSIQLYFK